MYHKYSSDYRNKFHFTNVPANVTVGPMPIDFNTGWYTTGRDWWYLHYHIEGDENYRSITPDMAGNAIVVVDMLVTLGTDASSSVEDGTSLFCPHTLTEDDAGMDLYFDIYEHEVKFSSFGKVTAFNQSVNKGGYRHTF